MWNLNYMPHSPYLLSIYRYSGYTEYVLYEYSTEYRKYCKLYYR